ncbi:MAG: beta-ketoacyl synthase N-terminal-like domain-containing protein, partial [Candidatus Hydrogenedentota bacterium]
MKKAVVTGLGVVSPLGANKSEVLDSLRQGRSGIQFQQAFKDRGLKSLLAGVPKVDPAIEIDRKHLRFMSDAS